MAYLNRLMMVQTDMLAATSVSLRFQEVVLLMMISVHVVSAVVIKRHDLAVADANHIHAVLVGTALTSCGSSMGSITTPSGEAQSLVIRNAYADAGLLPFQADFAELHGTGTAVGDSIEANAAGAVFSEGRNGDEILIGSVKSNIGHGEMGSVMQTFVNIHTRLTVIFAVHIWHRWLKYVVSHSVHLR